MFQTSSTKNNVSRKIAFDLNEFKSNEKDQIKE